MYKRDTQSLRKTLSEDKYLKYKQGYQDFQRDASNVTQYLTMGKCDNFSEQLSTNDEDHVYEKLKSCEVQALR